MVLERQFELWQLGTLFKMYHERILGKQPPPDSPVPVEAKDGLDGKRAIISRPGPKQTPDGLVTWSPRGGDVWLDFFYTTEQATSKFKPRGAELILAAWQTIVEQDRARSVKTSFARELAASDDDFFSPIAKRLGMHCEDDILLTQPLDEALEVPKPPKGIRFDGWHDGLLDKVSDVMMGAPDPTRLDEWSEQVCRDEILWSAAGHPPGFGNGRAVLAWAGTRMVGCGLAAADGLVTQVHVLPEFQNRGLGTAMLCELLARMKKAGHGEASFIVGDTNGEALRLAERVSFVDELHYPLWKWQRQPLNLSGVDMAWNGRLNRSELSDLFLRAASVRAFTPARLEEVFRRSQVRLVVRHLGSLLAVARLVGDGCSSMFVADFVVDPAYRFQGLGRLMTEAILERYSGMDRLVFACGEELSGFLGHVGLHDADPAFLRERRPYRGKIGV